MKRTSVVSYNQFMNIFHTGNSGLHIFPQGFECYLKAILKIELQLWDKKVRIHIFTFLIRLVCTIENIDQFYIDPLLVVSLLLIFLYMDEIQYTVHLSSQVLTFKLDLFPLSTCSTQAQITYSEYIRGTYA